MKAYYVIEDITGGGFWDAHYRKFRGYVFTWKYDSEELAKKFCDREGLSWENDYAETSFIEGWNSAEEKLGRIIKQLQKEQITSTVYILREVLKRMTE